MFERIKAYRKINKMDKYIKEAKVIAEFAHDDTVVNMANETLYINEVLRKEILFNRKKAEKFNLECIKKGI